MPFESSAWQLTDNSINASSFKYLVTNAKQETPLGLVSVRLDVIICTKCSVCLEFFEHVYISMDDFEAVKKYTMKHRVFSFFKQNQIPIK